MSSPSGAAPELIIRRLERSYRSTAGCFDRATMIGGAT